MVVCPTCGQRSEQAGFCVTDGSELVATTDALLGTEVGRYRLARLLGEGGMGQVYLGVQPAIGSRVAIKVLSNECTRNPELLERFFSEARAVNLVRHENIASVIDMAQLPDGRPYIVMEFIEGQTLGGIVRAGGAAVPLGGIVQVLSEVLSALGAAHALGIVHRDLKPDNVIVTAEGHAKVLDFGIAKLAPGLGNAHSPRTRTGALLGTPQYMAPEQISGAELVDARSDIYAAGVVLFEACTGRVPFLGATLYDLMREHLEQAPPAPRELRPDLPVAMQDVILTALAKEPARRFQSAAAMVGALHHASSELPSDQWRALSSRSSPAGRPSFEQLMRPSKFDAAAHAPTARATPLPTTIKDAGPATVSTRSRAPWFVLAGLAVVVGGVVAAVALGRRGEAVDGAHAAGAGTATVASTEADGSVVATELPETGGSATSQSTEQPLSAASDAPPSVVVVNSPPSHGSPPATLPPKLNGSTTARTSPPVVATSHDAGPTSPGGGSAADHGVHDGANVYRGQGVVRGGGAPRTPQASVTRPVDYNPKKFDGGAYMTKALALARTLLPDVGFVRAEVPNVHADGLAHVGMTSHDDPTYLFRSPSASAWPVGVPRNADIRIPCYVEVTIGAAQVTAKVRTWHLDVSCRDRIRPIPRCSHAQIWAKAQKDGAAPDTVAEISFMPDDGTWDFDNQDGDGVGLHKSYADRCP